MTRSFKTLFDLTMVHGFYTDKRSNDFVFIPTSDTQKDLRRYKVISRSAHAVNGQPESHRLTLSYEEIDASPVIPISAVGAPKLVFGINLQNVNFWNYTSDVENLESGEVFYYTNIGATESSGIIELTRSRKQLRRKTFAYNFKIGAAPVIAEIEVFDESNTLLADYGQTLSSENGDFQSLVDLTGLPDGVYKVSVTSAGLGTVQTDNYYISDELTYMKPFAILDVRVANNIDLTSKELRITFQPRAHRWKYFVVFNPSFTGVATTTVSAVGLTFNEISTFTGGGVPPSMVNERLQDKATKESLEERYSTSTVKLFESSTDITYEEAGKKDIKLKNGTLTLIKHLPGPALESPKPEAYIFI